MFWLLARELLRMRGDQSCLRTVEWKESVDLFFYRDADEIKRQQDAKLAKQQKAARAGMGAYGATGDQEEDNIIDYGQEQAENIIDYQEEQPYDMGAGGVMFYYFILALIHNY